MGFLKGSETLGSRLYGFKWKTF